MHRMEDIKATTDSENNPVPMSEIEQSTVQLSLKSHCYSWTINDFFHCLKFRNCQFNSPNFVFQNTEWYMRLCVITENDRVKNMKVHLQNKGKIDSDLYFKNITSIVDDEGKVLSEAYAEFCATDDNVIPSSPVYLVVPWTSESFVLPNRLTVRCEFSSLKPEMIEDSKPSLIKSDSKDASDSQFAAKTVYPQPKRRTARTVLPRTRSTPSSDIYFERLLGEVRVLWFTVFVIVGALSVLLMFSDRDRIKEVTGINPDPDAIPATIRNSEINFLIYDSTKKLSLIAEALNLTSVKEKSLEILALYSEMYNFTDHVVPVMQSIESNMTQTEA